ncbi:MAG TPA: TetR family transcriptional regulator [Ktedonobacterales bacterium]
MPSPDERQTLGLRERKKAKTKAAIQHHALRLFEAQGYDATTVEQIAEAAEISPSTFFRYFPTKEDVVLYDDLDPIMIAAFEAQPPELSPIQALRGAMRAVFFGLPAEESETQWERMRWFLEVPELRMRMLDQLADGVTLIAGMLAQRTGRDRDDFEVRAYSGALIGVIMAALLKGAESQDADYIQLMDDALEYLERGLPL